MKAELVSPAFLEEEEFDQPLGIGSGAGVIFGATGGVMEAALRSAHFLLTGKNPKTDAFKKVRGVKAGKKPSLKSKALQSRWRSSADWATRENC